MGILRRLLEQRRTNGFKQWRHSGQNLMAWRSLLLHYVGEEGALCHRGIATFFLHFISIRINILKMLLFLHLYKLSIKYNYFASHIGFHNFRIFHAVGLRDMFIGRFRTDFGPQKRSFSCGHFIYAAFVLYLDFLFSLVRLFFSDFIWQLITLMEAY